VVSFVDGNGMSDSQFRLALLVSYRNKWWSPQFYVLGTTFLNVFFVIHFVRILIQNFERRNDALVTGNSAPVRVYDEATMRNVAASA